MSFILKQTRMKLLTLPFLCLCIGLQAQNIGDFVSVEPASQNSQFIIPSTHRFQKIIEVGDALTAGGTLGDNNDFAGYVPIGGSSENGYLSINAELTTGQVSILDINYNPTSKLWGTTASEKIDFSSVVRTSRNCSGTVTPWNTIVTCEEATTTTDANGDLYNDLGWCVEIDPVTKTVIDKRWALGNFKHENIVVHSNRRTVYEGADSNPGYLYKFVADNAEDLSSGKLYVYNGSKSGSGNWILINNTTAAERNTTLAQSSAVGATVFNGIEDVEISPTGWIYFAVKGEGRVYRFQDSDPLTGTTVPQMETYVGGTSYTINHHNGSSSLSWGTGNDNLAFDGDGNLWVLQDGGNDYIWVVKNGHTQAVPQVELFAITPSSSEPTGITFSPDFRFLFMSIQHPSSANSTTMQLDAAGIPIGFGKDITLVIALNDNLGSKCAPSNTLNIPIRTGIDDVEEASTGTMYTSSTDLELVDDTGANGNGTNQTIGLRFQGLMIPPAATITNAYIQFTVDEVDTGATSLLIEGENEDNSATFTTAASNLSTRTRTSPASAVAWSPVSAWSTVGVAGVDQRTPDLSAIVQEIVNRGGWTATNAMSFILTGTGKRTADSFEGGNPPILHVEYTTGICLNLKVFLQGPYNGVDMDASLNAANLLPPTEPYSALGYSLQNAGIIRSSSVTAWTGGDEAIDWILVELRNASNTVLASTAALLQKDGDIVGTDGTSFVHFQGLSTDDYYVVVRHRNHLGVMTATPVTIN